MFYSKCFQCFTLQNICRKRKWNCFMYRFAKSRKPWAHVLVNKAVTWFTSIISECYTASDQVLLHSTSFTSSFTLSLTYIQYKAFTVQRLTETYLSHRQTFVNVNKMFFVEMERIQNHVLNCLFFFISSQIYFVSTSHFLITATRAYSISLLCSITVCIHLPFFKIYSNFVYFCPNVQIICPFFNIPSGLFWKIALTPLLSRKGPDYLKMWL